MPPPLIAWLTDFGTADHYVGVMKAVVLTIAPTAVFIDITHDIAPQDVLGASLALDAAYRYFPPGTIFVTVVDPGVGSTRRALAVRAGGFTFLSPDNGLLTPVLRAESEARAVVIAEPRFALSNVSRTFEGRDRFAPAAAWLANGVALDALGPHSTDFVMLDVPVPRATGEAVYGEILRIDKFGNAVSNITAVMIEAWEPNPSETVEVGDRSLGHLVSTYADVAPGTVCALFGSSGHLEIAISGGSAASSLGLARGSTVTIRRARSSR